MTREEQRKLRELKKALPRILNEKIKNYKFKKKDYMIWYNNQERFFKLLINVSVIPDGRCFCSSRETIDDFISNIENPMYHKELREALTFVHNHKYLEALNCLNELGDGYFKNGEISINKEIREFCRDMLK